MEQAIQQTQHAVDSRFIQRIGDKDFVTFTGLLDLAHRQGLKGVDTALIQAPGEANAYMAIVKASVTTDKGNFTGIGDATPKNVNSRIAPHIVRMAETRAVARALRLACNIGMCSVEELGGDSEGTGQRGRNGKAYVRR